MGLAAAALCGLTSCDKVKNLIGQTAKKTTRPATPYAGPLVAEIPESDYETLISQPGRVIVIDFHADQCGLCSKLAPLLEQIATQHNGLILVGKIDVDRSEKLATALDVQGLPDVRIFRDGTLVDQFVGMPPEAEIRRRIETHTEGLPAPIPANAPKPVEPVTRPMEKDWMPAGMQRR